MPAICKKKHALVGENIVIKRGRITCRQCRLDSQKRSYAANPAKHIEQSRRWLVKQAPDYPLRIWLKGQYGITLEKRNEMLEKQQGKCAICLKEMKKVNVDHNHITGKVRELLCVKCNTGIGSLGEDPVVFQSALEYLKKHL